MKRAAEATTLDNWWQVEEQLPPPHATAVAFRLVQYFYKTRFPFTLNILSLITASIISTAEAITTTLSNNYKTGSGLNCFQ